MALPGTLNDYLKQKAAGTPVPSFGFPSSTQLPVAPKLPAPSFSVATVPPVMPAIATWDDVKHAALPVAPALPRLPDPSLPLAPKLPNPAETMPRFSASPTLDYVTRTSALPQPEKPSFWERSSAFANAPTAPSIWDRASKLNKPVAPVQTPAQPQFGSWSDARASGAARVNPFAAPAFSGAPATPTTSVNLPGTAATAWGAAPAMSTTPRYTPRLPEHSFASFAPAAPFNAATAFARQPSSAQATTSFSATTPTTTTSLTGRYTPLGNDTPFAAVAGGRPTSLHLDSNSASRSAGLSPARQSILADIDRIKRNNNIGDFDRLGIRLNSLSEGLAAGLDTNIAQARFERHVEDAVAEGEILNQTIAQGIPLPRPRPEQPRDGIYHVEGLAITRDFGGQYGLDATAAAQPFENIVIHHTDDDHDLDWYVNYGHEFDPGRGGYFGYHFYVGPLGEVVQGAPLTVRVNGAQGYGAFRNQNSVHVAMIGTQNTPEQIAAATTLVEALAQDNSVPGDRIVNHGNLQVNRGSERQNEAIWEVMQNVGALDGNVLRMGDGMAPFGADSRVQLAQLALKDWAQRNGHEYPVDADGQYGFGTLSIVLEFQRQMGLPETGVIDPSTQQLLFADAITNNPALEGIGNLAFLWHGRP